MSASSRQDGALASMRSQVVRRLARAIEEVVLQFSRPRMRVKDVMVVRVDAIGDFVVWIDAAKDLKQVFPGRKIVLLANSAWADLAGRLPYWDEVWPVDVGRFKRHRPYRWKLMSAVRRRGFEVAVQPTHSRSYLEGDALMHASGARERIGADGDERRFLPWQKEISDRWYTRLLPTGTGMKPELERNADFMRNLGIRQFSASVPVLPKLADLPENLRIPAPYFILFPGASWSGRQWPPDRFAELAGHLVRETKLMAVLCGSAAETALCEKIVERAEINVTNLAGQTSLPDFVEVVRGASLLIGNETSAIHIAAAVGTPAVCVLGGGHYGRFLPYNLDSGARAALETVIHRMSCFGCNWQCSQRYVAGEAVPCISGISTTEVLQASGRALQKLATPVAA